MAMGSLLSMRGGRQASEPKAPTIYPASGKIAVDGEIYNITGLTTRYFVSSDALEHFLDGQWAAVELSINDDPEPLTLPCRVFIRISRKGRLVKGFWQWQSMSDEDQVALFDLLQKLRTEHNGRNTGASKTAKVR